jgi:hypothetical protein
MAALAKAANPILLTGVFENVVKSLPRPWFSASIDIGSLAWLRDAFLMTDLEKTLSCIFVSSLCAVLNRFAKFLFRC